MERRISVKKRRGKGKIPKNCMKEPNWKRKEHTRDNIKRNGKKRTRAEKKRKTKIERNKTKGTQSAP